VQAFYLRAPDLASLEQQVHRLHTLLVTHGIQPIAGRHDLIALDAYIKHLPMNYEPHLDRIRRRGRLTFASHIASLLPLYGRSTGTGRPGMAFFNRAGELLTFDPLKREDRKKNAHMLILGPTGSGKSATVNAMLLHALAVHRPRVFIIDAGGSFDLFGAHCERLGLTVHPVVLEPRNDVSLPPFAGALRLLGPDADLALAETDEAAEEEALEEAPADPLGQMELAARIMVTGGEEDPLHRISRGGRLILRKSILKAAEDVRRAGRIQVLTEDVARALRTLPDLEAHRRHEAEEMAEGLELFCTGVQGHFFNREGRAWPQADITILELGLLAREGYEDSLAVAYTSIMSHIQDLVERHQRDGRATIVVNDEAHLITIHPLLAPYTAKAIRLWRKYGAWYWAITHSLEDFPESARRMLNMMEWWLCLAMESDEAEQVARFRELSPAQRAMLLSARKEPGKYTEGAVLGAHFQALVRIVPPPLALALAMTEPEEKAERLRIMRDRHCSELEAAYAIAERLAESGA
jgi:conjugative transfer ATPase